MLDPGTALLSYSVAEDRSHLFMVDGTGRLELETLPVGETELAKLVREFREAILRARDNDSLEGLHKLGERLYQVLIAPAVTLLDSSERLLIVPDGPLHLLPFAALVRPEPRDAHSPYLVEWKALHIAASVTVYDELRKARRNRETDTSAVLLAFGDPRYPRGESIVEDGSGDPLLRSLVSQGRALRPLPGTREEVQAIVALFGKGSTALLGVEATEEPR